PTGRGLSGLASRETSGAVRHFSPRNLYTTRYGSHAALDFHHPEAPERSSGLEGRTLSGQPTGCMSALRASRRPFGPPQHDGGGVLQRSPEGEVRSGASSTVSTSNARAAANYCAARYS